MPRIIRSETKTRGKARPEMQISDLQRSIIYWLWLESIELLKSPETREIYERTGVTWSTKRLFEFINREISYISSAVILSKSLTRLEERSLVTKYKQSGITKSVKLTPLGVKIGVLYHMKQLRADIEHKDSIPVSMIEGFRQHYKQILGMISESKTHSFAYQQNDMASLTKLKKPKFETRTFHIAIPEEWPLESEDNFVAYMVKANTH